MDQFRSTYPETDPGHRRYGFNVGFMTGMLELGAFLGCLFLPYVADRISRKYALTMATGFFTAGAIIQVELILLSINESLIHRSSDRRP